MKRKGLLCLMMLSLGSSAFTQDTQGGNTFFASRTDEPAACVLDNDVVTIEAFQPLVKPNGDWLAKGNAGGYVAYITVTSNTDQPVKHSLLKEVQFTQDDRQSGLVRLNQTMLITNQLVIKASGQPKITAVTLAFEYIGKKTPTAWGAGLQAMANLVNILPLPPSPYTAAAKSLAQFTSGVVDKSLQVDKPGVQDPKANLDIPLYGRTILPTGKTRCMANLEVGAYALIDAWPTNGDDDFVDINKPTNYCMKAEPGGGAAGVTFWFQKRQSADNDGNCTGNGDNHILGNPHIPVLVTAYAQEDIQKKSLKKEAHLPIGISKIRGKLVAENMKTYSREAQASLRLCTELKVPITKCFGFDDSKLSESERQQLRTFEMQMLK